MNKSIKLFSLALLLSISAAHGMEKEAMISASSKPFTAHGICIPDDVLENIFKYVYPNEIIVDDFDNVNALAEMTQKIRSVCKHWHHTYDPVEIRKKLNWNPHEIASFFNTTSVGLLEKYYRHMTFLVSTLKDQPDLINLHNIIRFRNIRNTQIALAHGVNPNEQRYGETPSLYALERNNREAFTLLLDHGADINRHLLFTVLKKTSVLPSICLGFLIHSMGVIAYTLERDPSKIQSNLPIKYICSLITSITGIHLVCVCPFIDQWPLTTILKHYWKKLITFNRS